MLWYSSDNTKHPISAAKSAEGKEETFRFPAKTTHEQDYICIVTAKPADGVYVVSAYMSDEYLGQYVMKIDWYFSGKSAADDAFDKASSSVEKFVSEYRTSGLIQARLPYVLRERLLEIKGDIKPKVNKMTTYLNPENTKHDYSSQHIIYIPTTRSVKDDLEMGDQK